MISSNYEITSPSIIHCGAGKFNKIADETASFGKDAVIVTGAHLHTSERILKLIEDLRDRGVDASLADPIISEPTVDMIDDLAAFVRKRNGEVIVAIGGGSVMDAAKAAAVMTRNDGFTEEYQLRKRELVNSPLKMVFAPTTAGTGSEATRVSVLTNTRVNVKRSISHPLMTPDAVILDPELIASCSKYLTTITAMDAFAHAIESAVSRQSTPYTRHIALAGIEKLNTGLTGSQQNPNDLESRLKCLLGSCFAGLAMQAGLGAAHSLAPSICIVTGTRHSEAVGALLPHAIRLNERIAPGSYDEVKRAMDCDDIAARLEEFCSAGGFKNRVPLDSSDWGVVYETMNRYAGHRKTNAVEVTDDYAKELFEMSVGK